MNLNDCLREGLKRAIDVHPRKRVLLVRSSELTNFIKSKHFNVTEKQLLKDLLNEKVKFITIFKQEWRKLGQL